MRRLIPCAALILTAAAFAAAPPERMNYQGVLRDSAGDALDGDFDMVFRFFDAETLGDEILVDRHLAANAQAVQVAGGLFSVDLGGGEVLDGSGPGVYAGLSAVFASHGEVWMEIEVGGETLTPRLPVMASAFALNAGSLDGRPAADFLDGSTTEQAKTGKLITGQPTGTADAYGFEAYGSYGGAYFEDTDQTGRAYAAWDEYGILGYGGIAGGYFRDESYADTYAFTGSSGFGIRGYGFYGGGYFADSDGSGVANVGYNDQGIWASGDLRGGYFRDGDQSGYAYVGSGDDGISAHGNNMGGYFTDLDGSGYAKIATGDNGLTAHGSNMGAHLTDIDGTSYANVAYGGYGIQGHGDTMGGYFRDSTNLAYAYVGYGNYGIQGYGNTMGGYFKDSNGTGYAHVGDGDHGIKAFGATMGGHFDDTNGSGFAYVAFGEWGLYGYGNAGGVQGVDLTSGTVGYLGTGSSSTGGNGTKNFIQNHPYRDDQVIYYTAPEGNEVATYTRGSARLHRGEARIALDETFAWVTNPDIGLTAHLTPRTPGAALYVAELTSGELVVRADADSAADAAFDYMVWGLRIGFEEFAVVREKGEVEAYIPAMDAELARQQAQPELRKHVALERFKAMHRELGRGGEIALTAATALRDAVGTYDPAVHQLFRPPVPSAETPGPPVEVVARGVAAPATPQPHVEADGSASIVTIAKGSDRGDKPHAPTEDDRLAVSGPVAAGDLLVMDASGRLTVARDEADPGVVGVAAEDAVSLDGETVVALASSGIATLKVDADLGPIARGDLLVSSPTPGHGMRAYGSIPGTVVAKALEPLEAGRGTIRVAVTLR